MNFSNATTLRSNPSQRRADSQSRVSGAVKTGVIGFASGDQFHVDEGATARSELRGTMTIAL